MSQKDDPLLTVFFGGGTPSVIGVERVSSILDAVVSHFGLHPGAEVSIEVNPATVDYAQLVELRQHGFSRISIGIQCFDDDMLKILGRRHSSEQAKRTVSWAREAGFSNISVDIMSALPSQTTDQHITQLTQACELKPEHISCYSLTLETNTPLARLVEAGKLCLPDDETQAEMMMATWRVLAENGYHQYEVSNYCLPGFECRHNQVYWQSLPYFGFGPAAVSTVNGVRQTREPSPTRYTELMEQGQSVVVEEEQLTTEQQRFEYIMLALRTTDGFSGRLLNERFGGWPELAVICGQLHRRGLLTPTEHGWALTRKGMLLANEVMMEFLP